jgi:hypothetical protein
MSITKKTCSITLLFCVFSGFFGGCTRTQIDIEDTNKGIQGVWNQGGKFSETVLKMNFSWGEASTDFYSVIIDPIAPTPYISANGGTFKISKVQVIKDVVVLSLQDLGGRTVSPLRIHVTSSYGSIWFEMNPDFIGMSIAFGEKNIYMHPINK